MRSKGYVKMESSLCCILSQIFSVLNGKSKLFHFLLIFYCGLPHFDSQYLILQSGGELRISSLNFIFKPGFSVS